MPPQLKAEYDVEPFNLNDTDRFTVNPKFYKDQDRTKAVVYCEKQQIISGRFAQPRDPSQTFLEKNFVYIPYDMRHAKDFPDREACLTTMKSPLMRLWVRTINSRTLISFIRHLRDIRSNSTSDLMLPSAMLPRSTRNGNYRMRISLPWLLKTRLGPHNPATFVFLEIDPPM